MSLKCISVTPERTVFDRDARFIALPLYDGEYGVGVGHTPVVGRLGAGELRLTSDDGSVERWYVEGGFMEAKDDVVSILTGKIVPLADLNPEEAEATLVAVDGKIAVSETERAERDQTASRARTQIRLAKRR